MCEGEGEMGGKEEWNQRKCVREKNEEGNG